MKKTMAVVFYSADATDDRTRALRLCLGRERAPVAGRAMETSAEKQCHFPHRNRLAHLDVALRWSFAGMGERCRQRSLQT